MPAETSQTLDRGLRVLTVLAGAPGGLTVTELSERLGVNRTVVYRLVTTLEQHGLVRRDAARGCTSVWGSCTSPPRCSRCCATSPRRCCAGSPRRSGCTAHLTVADGEEALALAVVEPSWTDFHVSYRVGSRHPLGQGAAGKAILLGREPVDDRAAYVITAGELQAGAQGLAAPVPDVEGLEASVGIVTLGDLDAPTAGPLVAEAASQLGALLHR